MKRRERSIEAGEGVPCPRCGKTSVKLVHSPGWKPEEKRNYYNYWYDCRNRYCRTRLFFGDSPLVMLETDKEETADYEISFTGPPPWY